MRHKFFGGVCPAPSKNMTRRKHISPLESAPGRVYIPLLTSCDGPARALVQEGDRVQVGQPIGAPTEEGVGVYVHASVSGRVAAILDYPHPWGGSAPTAVIDNDGADTPWEGRPAPLAPEDVNLRVLLERVEEAGVVGMGGDAEPTARKLKAAAGQISILIIDAAECEPYITCDHRLLMEHSDRILMGADVIARCTGANRIVLVTQGDKLNAAELVERRIRRHRGRTEIVTLRTRYPLGAEKQIVQTVTGQEITPGGTPRDAACLVLNVATLYAIQDALFKGNALTHRAVTVTGGGITRPRNLWVPIGTDLFHLMEETDGLRDGRSQVLLNGVMAGRYVDSFRVPVIKDTTAFIALDENEYKDHPVETTCLHCGKCVDACPMHLAPILISRAVRAGDARQLEKLHVTDCISCGCCSFACPANIPLTELVRSAGVFLEKGGAQ